MNAGQLIRALLHYDDECRVVVVLGEEGRLLTGTVDTVYLDEWEDRAVVIRGHVIDAKE